MADISKCSGQDCPIKERCYRYMAPSSKHWQAYMSEVPYEHDKQRCKMVWKIDPKPPRPRPE